MSKSNRRDQDGIHERPDSPYYWASYIDASGKRIRKSTGIQKSTEGRKEAEALLGKWKVEAHQTKQWGKKPDHTFDELMLEYLQGPSLEKRAPERDKYIVKRLFAVFSKRSLRSITPTDIRAYTESRRAMGIKNSTINREIGLLSCALNWARRELEWDVPNPTEGRKLKEPASRIRWISRDEADALLDAAKNEPRAEHLVDFIRLGLNTGMRRGEMLELEWKRVDLHTNLIYLRAMDQKSGKIGSVPLNADARSALLSRARFRATYCPDSPWVFCDVKGSRIQAVKRSFATACRRAGIENFHIHDLRHTCATWLVQAGVSIREVAEVLRHSDIRMTMRYTHLAPENVRSAVARLEGGGSRSGHAGISKAA